MAKQEYVHTLQNA